MPTRPSTLTPVFAARTVLLLTGTRKELGTDIDFSVCSGQQRVWGPSLQTAAMPAIYAERVKEIQR